MTIEMELVGVRVDVASNTPAMLLRETAGDHRQLNILIGSPEAQAIALALEGVETKRPLTHDLMVLLLDELDATVSQIIVTGVHERIYYADIVLSTPAGARTISARPSDAVALAVRTATPILATEEVPVEAGYVEWVPDEDDEDEADSEQVVEEFREFIDQVNPEDFAS